jgi:large subunit ribosomal protein L30
MYAVIRIGGRAETRKEKEDTMNMLRLKAVNNCVLLPETPDFKGMLENVRELVTYGEVEEKTLVDMLKKRLRLKGNKRVEEKELKAVTGYESFEQLAKALITGKMRLKDIDSVNPVFKLTPPSKGFKSTKEHYPRGDLGYRGKEINNLLGRMI